MKKQKIINLNKYVFIFFLNLALKQNKQKKTI